MTHAIPRASVRRVGTGQTGTLLLITMANVRRDHHSEIFSTARQRKRSLALRMRLAHAFRTARDLSMERPIRPPTAPQIQDLGSSTIGAIRTASGDGR
jgi:hypothetical protein